MKILGFILFLFGVSIAGGYASAIPEAPTVAEGEEAASPSAGERISAWFDEGGVPFLGGMALMILGGVIARSAKKPAASSALEGASPYREGAPSSDTKSMLRTLAEDVNKLPETLEGPDDDVQKSLDSLLEDRIPALLDARERMIEEMGLESFAEMIGQFAIMERGLARAWSAMTDECYAEVGPSIARAKKALEHAIAV